jgi:hypothetical protein
MADGWPDWRESLYIECRRLNGALLLISNNRFFQPLTCRFEFDNQDADLGAAYIFDAVGREWIEPLGRGKFGRGRSVTAVQENFIFMIAANEVAAAHDICQGGPTMGVHGNEITGRNMGMNHAHAIVFEKQSVVIGRSDEGVERVRPGPG